VRSHAPSNVSHVSPQTTSLSLSAAVQHHSAAAGAAAAAVVVVIVVVRAERQTFTAFFVARPRAGRSARYTLLPTAAAVACDGPSPRSFVASRPPDCWSVPLGKSPTTVNRRRSLITRTRRSAPTIDGARALPRVVPKSPPPPPPAVCS